MLPSRALIPSVLASAMLLGLLAWTIAPALGEITASVALVPWHVYAAIAALELANLIAGAQKWRLSLAYFRPSLPRPGLSEAVDATAVGTALGQVLPPQLATAGARSMLQARRGGAVVAVWTTMHEQLFDLIALCTFGATALAVLALDLKPAAAVGAGILFALLGLVSAQAAFWLGARLAGWMRGRAGPRLASALGSVADALRGAAAIPWRGSSLLLALGLLRMGLMTGRAVLVCAAILPAVPSSDVALGFPLVQFFTALPLLPGGLGLVEWTWTGLFAVAGVPAQNAAEAAITMRIVLLAAFGLVIGVLAAIRILRLIARQARLRGSPEP